MKILSRFVVAACLASGVSLTSAQAAPAAGNPALRKLIALDAGLRSYTAAVHADVTMHTFPYLSPSLDGMYYHKEPNKDKIVFTSGLPLMAQQFSQIYPRLESPSHWNDVYVISLVKDDGTVSTFKLVPRKAGRVDHIDATVDDRSGELDGMRWNYQGGGYASLEQRYRKVGGYDLVARQTGHFEDPHYNADVTSTFSDFKINAAIPDSIFSDNG